MDNNNLFHKKRYDAIKTEEDNKLSQFCRMI